MSSSISQDRRVKVGERDLSSFSSSVDPLSSSFSLPSLAGMFHSDV